MRRAQVAVLAGALAVAALAIAAFHVARATDQPDDSGDFAAGAVLGARPGGPPPSDAAPPSRGAEKPPALSRQEYLDLAAGAATEGRLADAMKYLEQGLAECPPEDRVARATFFERLADVNCRLERSGAAELFRENALRLAREAKGTAALLDLALAAGKDGDHRRERRHLHRLLLLSEELRADQGTVPADALALIAESLEAEWRKLATDGRPEPIPEPPLRFEDDQ